MKINLKINLEKIDRLGYIQILRKRKNIIYIHLNLRLLYAPKNLREDSHPTLI